MKDLVYLSAVFTNKEDLWLKIVEISKKIQAKKSDVIKNLYDNYVTRLLNVIEKKGDSK